MQINRKLKKNIEDKVKHNQMLRNRLINQMKKLELARNSLRQRKIQLKKLEMKKKSIAILGEYGLELKEQSKLTSATLYQKQ